MTDRTVVRIVAGALALVVVGAIVAATVLALADKTLPDLINNLAMGALGALGALLASTRTSQDPPQTVQVVNANDDAIPVTDIAPSKG